MEAKNQKLENAIKRLKANDPTLTSLYLSWNKIGDAGATALAEALKVNSALTTLNLRSNNIGDAGATALAEALKTNSQLTSLVLENNNIGAAGATALAEALKTNSKLTSLDLKSNNIGDTDGWFIKPGASALAAIEQLLAHNKNNKIRVEKFLSAAMKGDLNTLKKLQEEGVSIHGCNEQGMTALHYAAQNGHLPIVKYLISQGALINATNSDGQTALRLAQAKQQTAIVTYLNEKERLFIKLNECEKRWQKINETYNDHLKQWEQNCTSLGIMPASSVHFSSGNDTNAITPTKLENMETSTGLSTSSAGALMIFASPLVIILIAMGIMFVLVIGGYLLINLKNKQILAKDMLLKNKKQKNKRLSQRLEDEISLRESEKIELQKKLENVSKELEEEKLENFLLARSDSEENQKLTRQLEEEKKLNRLNEDNFQREKKELQNKLTNADKALNTIKQENVVLSKTKKEEAEIFSRQMKKQKFLLGEYQLEAEKNKSKLQETLGMLEETNQQKNVQAQQLDVLKKETVQQKDLIEEQGVALKMARSSYNALQSQIAQEHQKYQTELQQLQKEKNQIKAGNEAQKERFREKKNELRNKFNNERANKLDLKYALSQKEAALKKSEIFCEEKSAELEKQKILLAEREKNLKELNERYAIYEIPFEKLTKDKEIGKGNFGKVYLGFFNKHKVALKELQSEYLQTTDSEDFRKEVHTLSQLNSPFIVRFYGISESKTPLSKYLVMEYCSGGSLLSKLMPAHAPLAGELRLQWAWQIAEGLNYLHEKKVIHCDLAARNILLVPFYDERNNQTHWDAKISDFGLSKIKTYNNFGQVYLASIALGENQQIAPAWTAPEVIEGSIHQTRTVTYASDVYSYGVVLWEICTRSMPIRHIMFVKDSASGKIDIEINYDNYVNVRPEKDAPELLETLRGQCMQRDPRQRPTTSKILEFFRSTTYTLLNRQPNPSSTSHTPGQSSSSQDNTRPGLNG